MSEKWTHGQWVVNGDKIESTGGSCRARIAIIDDGAGTNPAANAQLIAAAPDIYVALKGIYDMLYAASDGERIWTMEMQQSARYALAKARGES